MRGPVNRWFVLVLVCVAQFMVVLDATIVNVALPTIQTNLDFSVASLQWVVNAYGLDVRRLPAARRPRFGPVRRQTLFIVGLAVFTIASLVNGLASSADMLIIGRGVAGPRGGARLSGRALDRHDDVCRRPRARRRRSASGARSPRVAERSGS